MPKVSVVMPTYNRGYCLAESIQSILDQTFEDWELIIVDDGSTDDTEGVVRAFKDKRIIYKKLDHTGHIGAVRNAGNALAKADIIVVQDSDDMSHPNRLGVILNHFKDNDADVVYHALTQDFNGKKTPVEAMDYDRKKILFEQYLPGQCAYKKSLWEKYPYDEETLVLDDMILHTHFSLNNAKYGCIKESLYSYNVKGDSINRFGQLGDQFEKDMWKFLEMLYKTYGIIMEYTLDKKDKEGNVINRKVLVWKTKP